MTEAFRAALDSMRTGWRADEDRVLGPNGEEVKLLNLDHSDSDGHVDVEFLVHKLNGVPVIFSDCVSGFGSTPQDRAKVAAHRWAQTTAAAVLELVYSRQGYYAGHYFGADSGGFTGWHSICGGLMPLGDAQHSQRLIEWWEHSSPLPGLSEVLSPHLEQLPSPQGLKIFFGNDDIAEVRLAGEIHDGASDALWAMDWPRGMATLRTYLIPIHRDCTCGATPAGGD